MTTGERSVPLPRFGRRAMLAGGMGLAAALAAPRMLRAQPMLDRLAMFGPPAGPSITLAHAVARGLFEPIAGEVSFATWKDPDELRAGIASGTMQVTVLPTQAAANLYNRGLGVRLANVMTDGLTYVMAADPGIAGIADLAGRSVALPFRNDTPDILLRRLMAEAGLAPDAVKVAPASNPIEAVQLLLSGRAEAAVLPEPAATLAEIRGEGIRRAIDMQTEWGRLTGLGRSIPQAGLGIAESFATAHPEAVEAIQRVIETATAEVNADPAAAAANASAALGTPAEVLARSIPHCALVATRASDARPALEAMYRLVAETDPRIIGGRLPDGGLYLL